MGDYVKKQKSVHPRDNDLQALLQRLVRNTHVPPQPPPVQQINIDATQIANVVAQSLSTIVNNAVENNLKNIQVPMYNCEKGSNKEDSYDSSKSLEKLAESMLVQRSNSQSNFDDLGGVNISKKDSKETQNTIDLLKNLDD